MQHVFEITGMLTWSCSQVNSISAQAGAAKTWSDGQGLPRTPKPEDRHVERSPFALREVNRKVLSTS